MAGPETNPDSLRGRLYRNDEGRVAFRPRGYKPPSSSTGQSQRSPNPDMDMGEGRETIGRNEPSRERRRRLGEGARRLASDQVQGMRGGSRTLLG